MIIACCMNVNVGNLSDPIEIPGLAHFCEHMLFLGTKKYPDENSYSSFLSTHGGSSNAFTSFENTSYIFDVLPQFLPEALDRFAQFFICPLFNASATDRELKAVDSEHQKNIQDDSWRLFQLERSTSSNLHPYHKFATGNRETLESIPQSKGIDVQKALYKFHSAYYSANRMTLAILGKESLDALENYVRSYFTEVPNKNIPKPEYFDGLVASPAFPDSYLGKRFLVTPVKDIRKIELCWAIPSMRSKWMDAPYQYISNLIGHEGPGSILSFFKKMGWANGLSAGLSLTLDDFSTFKVTIEATEKGITQYADDIVAVIYAYIGMLVKEGPKEWIWKENATQQATDFRFKSVQSPYASVTSVAGNMHLFEPRYVLSGPYILRRFNPDAINEFFSYLTPHRMRLVLAHKSFSVKCDQNELWYKTPYQMTSISEETLKRWQEAIKSPTSTNTEISFPPPNEFLPTDFSIFPFEGVDSKIQEVVKQNSFDDTRRPPKMIHQTKYMNVWFKQDNVFKRPKMNVLISLKNPVVYESPLNSVLSELYSILVRESLNEYAYASEIAGLSYSISNSITGLMIRIKGYNHKLPILVDRVLSHLTQPSWTKNMFDQQTDRLLQAYQNYFKEQPYQHSIYFGTVGLNEPRWHVIDKLEDLKTFVMGKPEVLNDFVSHFSKSFSLDVFIHGNYTASLARNLAIKIENLLYNGFNPIKPLSLDKVQKRVVKIPDQATCIYYQEGYDVNNPNAAIEATYQIGLETDRLRSLLILLDAVGNEPCFNFLRTEHQLGYIVHLGSKMDHNVLSLRVIVQSTHADPIALDEKIEEFMVKLERILSDMDEETFKMNVSSCISLSLEYDKTLDSETGRWWYEIENGTYSFDKSQVIAKELGKLSKKDLIDFFNEYIQIYAPKRKKFVAGVFNRKQYSRYLQDSKTSKSSGKNIITISNLTAFRDSQELYPSKKEELTSKL